MKKLLYAVALLGTMSLASCEDFLTAENKGAPDENYFYTAAGLQSLVYDCYGTLDAIYNSTDVPAYFNAGTDLYCNGRGKCNTALHSWDAFTPENGTVKNFYNACYNGIRAAYAIQYYAAKSVVKDEDVKTKAIDEGRFVAAFYYYLLVNNFGGVPLMKEYTPNPVKGYPRATATDVYDYIIAELTDVLDNNKLAASTAKKGGGEASIEAARALLAKTYLAAAWDLNEPAYFKKAAEEADKVINGRELTTDFAKLWKADYSGDDDAEFIFDVEYSNDASVHDQKAGNRWQSFFGNYYGGKEEGMKNGSSSYIPTLHALKYFTKEDKRYFATFMPVMLVKEQWPNDATMFKKKDKNNKDVALGDYFAFYSNGEKADGKVVGVYYPAWWESDEASIAAWRAKDPKNREKTFVIPQSDNTYIMEPWKNYMADEKGKQPGENGYTTPKVYDFNHPDTHLKSWSTTPCRKFDDSKTKSYDAGRSLRDLHVITLPEIFFVAAEAYLKDNQTDKALARLNSVRKRAGLADETSIDIDKILKESACEMFGNGYRRMDLRRTGKLVEYNNLYNPQLKGEAVAKIGQKLLWPIPQAAIDANGLMTSADQNPGY